MIKRQWFWIIIVLLLLISLPGLYDRWQTEVKNNTYELVTPYQEIVSITADSAITINQALFSLKESGLHTVSISPITLDTLEKQKTITIYGQEELEKILRFSNQTGDYKQKQEGFYTTIPKDPYYVDKINENFDPIKVKSNDQSLYFIPDEDGTLRKSSIGYDKKTIKQVKQHNLNYILRVENVTNETTDGEVTNSAINERTIKRLIDLKDEDVSNLLFSGQAVIGYPNLQKVEKWTKQLNEAGYGFYTIEFVNQKAIQSVARALNYDAIRLHSLPLGNESIEESVNRAVRAVKERNIRTIFFHLPKGEAVESLESASAFIESVNEEMPSQFTQGTPEPFEKIYTPDWIKVIVLLAGILFTFIAADVLNNNKIRITSIVFMFLLAASYFLLQNLLFLKAFALVIAIITPIYAIITSSDGTTNIRGITCRYAKAIGISFVGIAIVLSLLNGNAFITGSELFRGVKLVYIAPILFLLFYLLLSKRYDAMNAERAITILRSPVKYWHIIIILFIGFVAFYYINRTGNTGSVSELELLIRHKLETYLYVRPRTKEFLIGFPIYMVALYTMGISKKWGRFLLIPGIIGFLSIMNTFTHFHIPLYISLLRTAYSIVIGYIIGIFLIYLVKICLLYIPKFIKTRWS